MVYIKIKNTIIDFKKREFKFKGKIFTQRYIEIVNLSKRDVRIIGIDRNIYWKPVIRNEVTDNGSKYKEFSYLFFQMGFLSNIPTNWES